MAKILCILDGFGLALQSPNNCIALAKMPTISRLFNNYPFATLNADGEMVGQETGLVGNSEVGHMNLGGLKLVKQLSYQITKSAEEGFILNSNLAPDQIIDPALWLQNSKIKIVNLVGLFSTGSIHSDLRHWVGAIQSAYRAGATKIVLHLISDGRDSDRKSFLETLENFLDKNKKNLDPIMEKLYVGSFGGRGYAMDRDNNFDKVAKGLEGIFGFDIREQREFLESKFGNMEYTREAGEHFSESLKLKDACLKLKPLVDKSYKNAVYDEFLEPTSFGSIGAGEALWLINFRADRMRQAVSLIAELESIKAPNLKLLAMNDFGSQGEREYEFVFKSKPASTNLATMIAKEGKTQLHIAETEKFNHVTFFLNGGQSQKQIGEEWVMVPSNKLMNHSDMPEMKAKEITDYLVENLHNFDYVIVNYANPDMVGHCGDIAKGVESMEFLDTQLERLIKKVEQEGHTLILTADHGNMEFVGEFVKDGKTLTDTEHNANPVPLVIVNTELKNAPQETLKKLIEKLETKGLENLTMECSKTTQEGKWLNEVKNPTGPLWYAGAVLFYL
jgi:2,3-bisphosphoglycerate-independent phosphoglycerate mutase